MKFKLHICKGHFSLALSLFSSIHCTLTRRLEAVNSISHYTHIQKVKTKTKTGDIFIYKDIKT